MKTNLTTLILLLCLLFSIKVWGQEAKVRNILKKSMELYDSVHNGKYEYIHKFKTIYNVKDTSINHYICIFQKDKQSKLGVRLNIRQLTQDLERIYDGQNAYFIKLSDHTGTSDIQKTGFSVHA